MDAPFIYGKLAVDDNFTDRSVESERLITNFLSLTNTILISPRRWGKSSLVKHSAKLALDKDPSLRFCFIDMFDIRDEEKFFQKLAEEILKATSSKLEGIIDQARKFMGNLLPKFTFSPDSTNDFSLTFDWHEVKKNPDSILDLAENIAQKKGLKIIVCFDEFQNIGTFSEPLQFQQKLRSRWQKHQMCSYCLYGSKRHMMLDVFANPSMPFYQFGDIIFLEKIKQEDWIPFIVNQFAATGKLIGEEQAILITRYADCHPYYVQQLAQQTWFRTKKHCTTTNVQEAFEGIIQQMSLLFQTRTDELIETQLNLLKAIIIGETQLSSRQTIELFKLGTSANVVKSKKMLINKEIIDNRDDKLVMLDPLYQYWLAKYYFKI